jgi:polysaccharide pyruvyl transferase CsaB
MTLERERASLDLRRPTRIGISGSYGGMNLGDEAILQSIIAELRRRIPGSLEVLVFSMGPADTLARHDVERALPVRELSRAEVTEEIGGLDLFILGGGGLLYNGEARHYVRELQIAREFGIPAMTWALGAGPLDDREDRSAVRRVLNRTDAIVVRDERDRRLLQEVGVARDVSVTADPALLMKPEPFTPDMLRAEGLAPGTRLIGLSVREPGPAAPGLEIGDYHSLLANAADFLVDRLGATVVFVPMERCRSDLQHAHGVLSRMALPQHARILYAEYTPGQVLGFMSHLELAIGMRLHFLIFAALAGVTFVPLPYASKVEGLVHELGIPALPIQDLKVGRLLARIDHAWDMRDELRDRVTERLPLLRQRAARTAEMATTLVSSAAVTNP